MESDVSTQATEVIVAGAGIWGCTIARCLAERGHKVLVLEKRPVVGGNVRCETDPETGIEIHAYGSHIFHTHLPEVWSFVRRFTDFNGYQHKVIAHYKGKDYFLPLGLTLINKFFNVELKPGELKEFLDDPTLISHPSSPIPQSRRAALFDAFFRGYTSKQWGKAPEEIDPSIIRRVPVRASYDVNYFNDYNQGIPLNGYNAFFDRLLDHPNITVQCNCELVLEDGSLRLSPSPSSHIPHPSSLIPHPSSLPIFYSGPIDALFGYRFGALPWRSLRFETERLDVADYQGTSVVNYTEAEIPWTRIHEFKHYHPEQKETMAQEKTVVMKEFPKTWEPGDEPYYPVNTPESQALLERYRAEAAKIPNLTVGGRLGEYRYYDMDQSVGRALEVAGKALA